MIPEKDMEKLVQYYKGELTVNAQLTKAAKLAAKKHVLMTSGLPPPIVNAQTKPLSQELMKLTKRIRQFPGGVGPGGGGGVGGLPGDDDEEEGDLVTGPVDQWLKHMIKGTPSTPKPTIASPSPKGTPVTPTTSGSTSKSKKRKSLPTTRTLFKKGKPSPSRIPGRPQDKGKGKGKGKGKRPEVTRLKADVAAWEDWKLRSDNDSD